jgi:2-hydroxymuconate-semialdehyde hydrolase
MKRILVRILVGLIAIFLILIAVLVVYGNYGIGRDEVDAIETHAPGRFLTIESRRMHLVTVGDLAADPTGAPLLVIHGFIAAGHASLTPWAPEKLGATRALILPDLLGYGYSERNTTPGDYYTVKSYSRYLAAMLDQLGVQQVDIVGHSYGSAIGARFALDYPARVRRIVFMSPGLYHPRSAAESIIELPLGVGRAVAWYAFGSGPVGFIARYCKPIPDCPWAPPAHIRDTTDTVRAMMLTSRQTPDLDELIAQIPQLSTQSMVLWGEQDFIVSQRDAQRMAEALRVRVSVVRNARHMPYLEQPDDVAKRVLDFLRPPGTGEAPP